MLFLDYMLQYFVFLVHKGLFEKVLSQCHPEQGKGDGPSFLPHSVEKWPTSCYNSHTDYYQLTFHTSNLAPRSSVNITKPKKIEHPFPLEFSSTTKSRGLASQPIAETTLHYFSVIPFGADLILPHIHPNTPNSGNAWYGTSFPV